MSPAQQAWRPDVRCDRPAQISHVRSPCWLAGWRRTFELEGLVEGHAVPIPLRVHEHAIAVKQQRVRQRSHSPAHAPLPSHRRERRDATAAVAHAVARKQLAVARSACRMRTRAADEAPRRHVCAPARLTWLRNPATPAAHRCARPPSRHTRSHQTCAAAGACGVAASAVTTASRGVTHERGSSALVVAASGGIRHTRDKAPSASAPWRSVATSGVQWRLTRESRIIHISQLSAQATSDRDTNAFQLPETSRSANDFSGCNWRR